MVDNIDVRISLIDDFSDKMENVRKKVEGFGGKASRSILNFGNEIFSATEQLDHMSKVSGISVDKLQSSMRELNLVFSKQGTILNSLTGRFVRNSQAYKDITRNAKRFRMELLSVLFINQAIKRSLDQLIKSTVSTYTEITKSATSSSVAVSSLNAGFTFLKYTIGAAFARVLERFLPTILDMIDMMADFIDRWGEALAIVIGVAAAIATIKAITVPIALAGGFGTFLSNLFGWGGAAAGAAGGSAVMRSLFTSGIAKATLTVTIGVLGLELLRSFLDKKQSVDVTPKINWGPEISKMLEMKGPTVAGGTSTNFNTTEVSNALTPNLDVVAKESGTSFSNILIDSAIVGLETFGAVKLATSIGKWLLSSSILTTLDGAAAKWAAGLTDGLIAAFEGVSLAGALANIVTMAVESPAVSLALVAGGLYMGKKLLDSFKDIGPQPLPSPGTFKGPTQLPAGVTPFQFQNIAPPIPHVEEVIPRQLINNAQSLAPLSTTIGEGFSNLSNSTKSINVDMPSVNSSFGQFNNTMAGDTGLILTTAKFSNTLSTLPAKVSNLSTNLPSLNTNTLALAKSTNSLADAQARYNNELERTAAIQSKISGKNSTSSSFPQNVKGTVNLR